MHRFDLRVSKDLSATSLAFVLSALLASPGTAAISDDENANDSPSPAIIQVTNTGKLVVETARMVGEFGDDDWIGIQGLRKRDRLMIATHPVADFTDPAVIPLEPQCDSDNPATPGNPNGFVDPTDCFGEPDTFLQLYKAGATTIFPHDSDPGLVYLECPITEFLNGSGEPTAPNQPTSDCLASSDDVANSDLDEEDHGSLIRFQVVEDTPSQTGTYYLRIGMVNDEAGPGTDEGPYLVTVWLDPQIQCNDGIDNDADGLTDTADDGCTDASDPSEKKLHEDLLDNDENGIIDDEPFECGIGPGLALVLPPLLWLHRRRARRS